MSKTTGTHSATHAAHQPTPKTRAVATKKSTAYLSGPIDLKHPPKGMNPALAAKVRAMHVLTDPKLQPGYPKKGTTHCNQAADAYAKQFGYSKLAGLNADQINKLMSNPKSGWHKVSEADAIKAAKAGKLTMESVPASAKHAHGHIAPVVGEWAPGKAGIAQAGSANYEWGSWRRETPSFFVHD